MIAVPSTVKDLTGQTHGHLTILGLEDRIHRGVYRWRCRCFCGNEKVLKGYQITLAKVRSCGCLTRQNANIKHVGSGGIPGWLWAQSKASADRRGIPFRITTDQLRDQLESQDGKCALTGAKLVFVPSKAQCHSGNASIDRIDSGAGYEVGNIQWVTKAANVAKRSVSNKEFIEFCKSVVNNLTQAKPQ